MDIKKEIIARMVFCILGFSVLLSSCESSTIEPIVPELPPADVKISFSSEIQPIFNDKCVGCHPPIYSALDLTEGNSYNDIKAGFIDDTTPEESKIYTKPDPSGSHSATYSIEESALVLRWIKEGALEN